MMAHLKRAAAWIASAAGIAAFVILIWQGPWWADREHLEKDLGPGAGAVVTGFRTAVVAVGAGVIASLGLYYTDRNLRHTREKDREQAELTREGQVTERYVSAVTLLASSNVTERLGGIYLLERIMHDSRKDQFAITKVLGAFLRQHPTACSDEHKCGSVDEDVLAAFSVIARRPRRHDQGFFIELRGLKVCGVELWAMDPEDAADLESLVLDGACLKGADLEMANLCSASLIGANLEKARLERANLSMSILRGAKLQGVLLDHANLCTADLTESEDLPLEELLKAKFNKRTSLPDWAADDQRVKAKLTG
ncbi:pentapeptide repeat-containing protein [Streptomyces amakusaensis]|uniref:Pentapeptide repeat-containing protein n=1 Tax=Streptomyces amakusaensis TaxID=67271 RepID=A0ABW0AQ73_9ACTN